MRNQRRPRAGDVIDFEDPRIARDYERLKSQRDDLEDEKADLEEAIAESKERVSAINLELALIQNDIEALIF